MSVMSKGPDLFTRASTKKLDKPTSPFASLLKDQVQQNTTERQNKELKNEKQQVFKAFTGEAQQEQSVEELRETIQELVDAPELSMELTEEMLLSEELSWLEMLPSDLLQKITSLFESGISLKQLLSDEGNDIQLENLLAGIIFVQQQTGNEQLQDKLKESLGTLFQKLNAQLHNLTKEDPSFAKQGLTTELHQFLSNVHAKLTGKNPIATAENEKLDYLRHLYVRTMKKDESVLSQSTQDSNSKVSFMGVETQNINRTQQFALFIEQSGSKTVNQEQFIKEFQSLLAKSNLQNANGGMRLLIKLYPEHLGQLRVELLQQNGLLTARMVSTTAAAKEMLESQLQGLKNAFAAQNIQVDKLEIINSQLLQEEFNRSLDRDGSQQQQQTRKQSQEEVEDHQDKNSFGATLLEELMNIEV